MASTIALLEVRQPAVQDRIRRAEAELAAATAEREAIAKALEGLRLLSSGMPLDSADEPHAGGLPAAPAAGAVREASAAAEPADRRVALSPSAPATAAVRTGKRTAAKKKAAATRTRAAAKTATPAPERKEQTSAPGGRKTARKATAKDTGTKGAAKRSTTAKEAARVKAAPAGGKPPVEATVPAEGRRRQVTDADSVLAVLSKAGKPLRAREVLDLLGLDASEGNINALRTRLERLARDGPAQRPGRGLYTVTAGRPESGK
ncbi:hypothetical protein [Kitasatospora sp. NPDC098663]|uniref:hypothetical protein n=1 Tax=Kitasatospora sp. NPDC098663 TaxID=3364096 RepID=UPI0037FBB1DC